MNHRNRAKRDRLCAYASCHNTTPAVTVNVSGDPAERPAFCSTQHAAMWLAVHHLSYGKKRETVLAALGTLLGEA